MDSLTDYILWMQDFTFSETGFLDVDALILSNLAYYDFSVLFDEANGPVYVRDAQKILDAGKVNVEIAIHDKKYADLLQAAVNSKRFGNLRMTDYIDIKRSDPPVQYAVETFHDESGLSFIAFRGTDDSLAGWYEDFIASFCKTEAQEMAKDYVTRVVSDRPERRWMMGGHSKGGNLAVYAGCTMDPEVYDHIERIYNLDGPGLSKDVMGDIPTGNVLEKTICIQPEFSVVGKLFDMHFPNTRIIKSSAIGALQHAPITWGVDHGKIASAEAHSPISIWVNEFIERWIECSSVEERKIFLSEIYEAISSGGATTISELAGEGLEGFKRVQSRLKNPSEVTKRVMFEFTRQAFFASIFPGHSRQELEGSSRKTSGLPFRKEKKNNDNDNAEEDDGK
ncbi:MAG: DUF2974 domain-containing protein [Lachnospiraceae bacterium]|nr:DUF2974 domain-containing protein [Lachnospiraceae bacterium]